MLRRHHDLVDPVPWQIADILREADLQDDRFGEPEAPGLDVAVRGCGWCARITAAVVGVIAHLAVFFAAGTLFAATRTVPAGPMVLTLPVPESLRWGPLAIAAVAGVLVFAARWPVLRVLALCAALGLTAGLVGLPVA